MLSVFFPFSPCLSRCDSPGTFGDGATRRSGPAPSVPGPGPSGSVSPSARSPAACCWPGSGGDQCFSSTSRSWSPGSQAPCCWCPTRRTRPPTRPIPGGGAVDRRPWPAAVGDHRGSGKRLGLRDGSRSRAGQPGRPRHLGPRPRHRAQVHLGRRPGGDRARSVADLRGVRSYHDLPRRGARPAGLGAGLLLPTAANCVVGSVPQGDSGMGSASNAVALQVGGALGVAVIGSVLSARYQDHMTAVLAGQHLWAAVTQTILSSLGGALAVAARAGASAPCSRMLPAPRS